MHDCHVFTRGGALHALKKRCLTRSAHPNREYPSPVKRPLDYIFIISVILLVYPDWWIYNVRRHRIPSRFHHSRNIGSSCSTPLAPIVRPALRSSATTVAAMAFLPETNSPSWARVFSLNSPQNSRYHRPSSWTARSPAASTCCFETVRPPSVSTSS